MVRLRLRGASKRLPPDPWFLPFERTVLSPKETDEKENRQQGLFFFSIYKRSRFFQTDALAKT